MFMQICYEAMKLPASFNGTRDIFRVYHFDVQFSGSDYENDPMWISMICGLFLYI